MMQIKDYYVPVIHEFEFIDTEEEAKRTIKTVLGILASSVSDETAQDFAAQLPDWLEYGSLRGGDEDWADRKPEDCIEVLKDAYSLEENQASALMRKVIAITVQNSTGDLSKLIQELPDEWEEIFNQSPKQENIRDESVL